MNDESKNPKQKKYNDFYMDIAHRVSQMSHARRLQVGSVLVKDGNIISFGWNGMPSGWDNNCEDEIRNIYDGDYALRTKPEVLHAEQNCLTKIARSTNSSDGACMFITHAPCIECAKSIFQSGIKKVFYRNTYRTEDGLKFLEKCEVQIERV
jgi:dCMP deaminase